MSAPVHQRVLRPARWAVAALSLALGACGGGGGSADATGAGGGGSGGGTGGADGLPSQLGCAYRYSLTSAPLLSGADPLLAAQWHLNNTGQSGGGVGEDLRALPAWASTRGEGARVAVVDDAIDTLHPDLSPNAVAGASYNYRPVALGNPWPLPCNLDDDHGTAVAGVILARDGNGVGGSGVAPRASLVGYNPLATGTVADIADALTRGLGENGVYNNSWGSPDDGALHRADTSFADAVEAGIGRGRGGRGAVYVFPAGNGGCIDRDPNGGACVSETTGLDGYLNHIGVIVACSVDHRGRRPSYGERGASVLLCAPASADGNGITTLAPQAGYRSDFYGSSAAAPMVSGVAALMLAANPQLSWRDVRLILAQTARRNDPASPDWVASRFGPSHHPDYGFGVVDASAAVGAARNWQSVGTSTSLKSCGPVHREPMLALPDPATDGTPAMREDVIAIAADCGITQIEYLEVVFDADHPEAGELRIRLISPNGLVSELAAERNCRNGCGRYQDWRFASVRHLGEPAAGSWRLAVSDRKAGNRGTWQRWSLRLWGR